MIARTLTIFGSLNYWIFFKFKFFKHWWCEFSIIQSCCRFWLV